MGGIVRIVNACLAALRPALHALWREKCIEIGIFSDECWSTSSEAEIINILHTSDAEASSLPGLTHYHRFETYTFEAMYPNLLDTALQEVMLKSLKSTFKHQSQHDLLSIKLRCGFANDHTSPVARKASWPLSNPSQLVPIVRAPYRWDLIIFFCNLNVH